MLQLYKMAFCIQGGLGIRPVSILFALSIRAKYPDMLKTNSSDLEYILSIESQLNIHILEQIRPRKCSLDFQGLCFNDWASYLSDH